MYDTIRLSGTLEDVNLSGTDFVTYLDTKYPDTFTISVNPFTKKRSLKAKLENLEIYALEGYIFIQNSFCKYLHGDNFTDFHFSDTAKAFYKLEAFLGFPIGFLKVGRLDFGANLILSDTVYKYFDLLIFHVNYKRHVDDNGIYFRVKGRRELIFYNKMTSEKKSEIPIQYDELNLLRYERRYLSKIKEQIHVVLRANHLLDPNVFNFLLDEWKSDYDCIVKQKAITIHLDSAKSPNDFMRLFLLKKLAGAGVDITTLQADAFRELEVLKASRKYFNKKKQKNRYVRKVKDEFSKGFKTSNLQIELDDKIQDAYDRFKQ